MKIKLSEIEQYCEAATAGPWKYQSLDCGEEAAEMLVVTNGEIGEPGLDPTYTICGEILEYVVWKREAVKKRQLLVSRDYRFIANARTDLPALVAWARKAKDTIVELQNDLEACSGSCHICEDDNWCEEDRKNCLGCRIEQLQGQLED